MKVIGTSNFDDELVSEFFVCSTPNKAMAQEIAEALNLFNGGEHKYFYKSVEDDHKLYKYEP